MSDANALPPALSAEEWHVFLGRFTIDSDRRQQSRAAVNRNDFHAAAALCLYGEDFGFTAEDVRQLHILAAEAVEFGVMRERMVHPLAVEDRGKYERRAEWLASVASRIASLLPPPPPETP